MILIFVILIFAVACEDIIESDPNYMKELLIKNNDAGDTLQVLIFNPHDYGWVKIRTSNSAYLSIFNASDTMDATIWHYENTDDTGLFSYEFPQGLPFVIESMEDTRVSKKILVKFIADSYQQRVFHDTLFFNHRRDYYLPIQVEIKF